MPNRINTVTDLQATADGCTVDFELRLARPSAGEGGNATATFQSNDTPTVGGSSVVGNLTADTVTSDPLDCCNSSLRVEATPAPPNTWDTVSSAADLNTALIPA